MREFSANLAEAFEQLGSRGTLAAGRYAVDIYLWRYVDDRSFQRDCQAGARGPLAANAKAPRDQSNRDNS